MNENLIRAYVESAEPEINQNLRAGIITEDVHLFDSFFIEADVPIKLFRLLPIEKVNIIDGIICDSAYMSCTKDIDKFIAEHGDELPFDLPESGQPAKFIKIEPPVDLSEFKADRKIEITTEQHEGEKVQEEKSEKKTSVKEKLKAGKTKSQETKSTKKDPKKDLQEAI